jgi:hypothetical protein
VDRLQSLGSSVEGSEVLFLVSVSIRPESCGESGGIDDDDGEKDSQVHPEKAVE